MVQASVSFDAESVTLSSTSSATWMRFMVFFVCLRSCSMALILIRSIVFDRKAPQMCSACVKQVLGLGIQVL